MKDETITRGGYFFVALCGVVILLLYAVVGFVQVRWLQAHKAETIQSRQLLLQSGATEIAKPAPDIKAQHAVKPVEVVVGIYVNRMGEFAVKEATWTADFDIWFRWTGTSVNPGETFRLVNGEIETREKHEAYASGEAHYARYRVKARIGKYFDPVRFPFADDRLTIEIEDSVHRAESLRYVADAKDSAIKPAAILQRTLKIDQSVAAVKTHDYGSARGHSGRQAGSSDVHSQFIFAALVSHPGGAFHLKLFHALFVSVAIALLVFFIKPTHVDPRFGLGVGALFAAVGNIIAVGAFLPRPEQPTLPDMVNTIGLVTIFFTLLQSTISLYLFDTRGYEKLSRLFDHVSFGVFFIGYTVVNVLLPIAAG